MEATMQSLHRETVRFSSSLVTCGILMIFLGITAISWPDSALVGAMFLAAALLALLGSWEMIIAVRARRSTPGWMVPMANGAACVGFALLTMLLPGLSLGLTLALVALWLAFYAALTGGLALALWPMRRTRFVLLAWTALNVSLATAAVIAPQTTIFTLLYVGAAYAVAFGGLQVASGVWIRHIAVPYVEPPSVAWAPVQ
jgi:uncharacterized membrane protein HdeD (DUF308 family)